MTDFLASLAGSSRHRAEATRRKRGESSLDARVRSAPSSRPLRLSADGFDLIAEAKLTSPADGPLLVADDSAAAVVKLVEAYARAGAAAVSVLTEPTRFDGRLGHLEAAAPAVAIPVMCKDVLVDPIQVLEARAAGASGVLLIAKVLDQRLLQEMTSAVTELGMFALVEIFDEIDLERAVAVLGERVMIGVNSRDLGTLAVDSSRLATFAPLLPAHLPWVAESGVKTGEDAAAAARLGYRLALVGTALVTSGDPETAAKTLIAAGRGAGGESTP